MDEYQFYCPSCNQKYGGTIDWHDKAVECQNCGSTFTADLLNPPACKVEEAPVKPETTTPLVNEAKQTMWWYRTPAGGQLEVPETELVGLIKSGSVSPETPVWRTGLENWQKAKECAELFAKSTTASSTPSNPAIVNIPSRLGQSIFMLVLFWPTGIIALIKSIQCKMHVDAGNLTKAQKASKSAQMWAWISFGAFLLSFCFIIASQGKS